MFGKRGQHTSIAILGIVIFIGLVGILYQVDKSVRELQESRNAIDDRSLANHMQDCLERLTHDATAVAKRGGFATMPERHAQLNEETIPIWLSAVTGTTQIPTQQQIEEAMANDISKNMPSCLDLFVSSYDIQRGTPTAQVSLTPGAITADLNYPLMLSVGNNRKQLSDWTAAVPVPLAEVFAAARTYAMAQQGTATIRLQALVDAAKQSGGAVSLTDIGNGMVAYEFKNGDAVLRFAMEYSQVHDTSFGDIATLMPEQVQVLGPITVQGVFSYTDFNNLIIVERKPGNHPPVIPTYTPQKVVVGRTLLIPLKVTDPDGDTLTYQVLTPMPGLEIKPGGLLQWGPTNYQTVIIKFRVADGTATTDGEITLIADYRPRVDFEKLSYP